MTITPRGTAAALLAVSLAAAGAPAATARAIGPDGPPAAIRAAPAYGRQDKSMQGVLVPTSVKQSAAPLVPIQASPSRGFDWSSAGIGAGGGLAVAIIALGGGLVVSQRRARTRRTPV